MRAGEERGDTRCEESTPQIVAAEEAASRLRMDAGEEWMETEIRNSAGGPEEWTCPSESESGLEEVAARSRDRPEVQDTSGELTSTMREQIAWRERSAGGQAARKENGGRRGTALKGGPWAGGRGPEAPLVPGGAGRTSVARTRV